MTDLHGKVSDDIDGDAIETALAEQLAAAGQKYNIWQQRATFRIREEKRLKQQVPCFATYECLSSAALNAQYWATLFYIKLR